MKRNLTVGFLLLYFSLLMIFVGGALFETFINYPNWVADIPASLTRTREFLAVRNPGMFFQTVVPLTIVTGAIFILVAWRTCAARNFVGASLVCLVGIELATFNLVYPRLRMLLGVGRNEGPVYSVEQLQQTADQLFGVHIWRMGFIGLAAILSAIGLVKFFARELPAPRS